MDSSCAKILIVEDTAKTQATLKAVFETLGCEIAIVDSSQPAFELLKKGFKPSVILLDMHLP